MILGIDTSNYTTSAALVDREGSVLLNAKILLPVKEGERGLRQSDAVFHHVRNLPEAARLIGEVLAAHPDDPLAAVGVSETPRDAEGSYMPCFLAGVSAAEMTARTQGVPLFRFSHQAGHVMAALTSACRNGGADREEMLSGPFYAFHVSGGTTDLLLVQPGEERIFSIGEIGGSKDINAGQAVDRVGVMMGFPFPAGPSLDQAAQEALAAGVKPMRAPVAVDGTRCNLSGLENRAAALWQQTGDRAAVSLFVLDFLARTLEAMTKNAFAVYGPLPVIYAGGVMSSQTVRRTLGQYGLFADAAFSADNAAGIAWL
ncbi:MAG: peptidase M22, partial [Clostridia bacterium]|nr:peptidase M22 [Clostridia bacterium]